MFETEVWRIIIKELILQGDSNEGYDSINYNKFDFDLCLKTLNVVEIPFDLEDKKLKGVLGYAKRYEGAEASASISIRNTNTNREKTFFHEVAHTQLHVNKEETLVYSIASLMTDEEEDNIKKAKLHSYVNIVAELEAECTAFLIISLLEFDGSDYSLGYIKQFSRMYKKLPFDLQEYAEKMVTRVLLTAETILAAGTVNYA